MHTASSPHTHDACSMLLWGVFVNSIFFVRVFLYVMLRCAVCMNVSGARNTFWNAHIIHNTTNTVTLGMQAVLRDARCIYSYLMSKVYVFRQQMSFHDKVSLLVLCVRMCVLCLINTVLIDVINDTCESSGGTVGVHRFRFVQLLDHFWYKPRSLMI